MPIVPSFTASQIIGVLGSISIQDTSSGSDNNIASRVVYVQAADGTYLVTPGTTTQYMVWSYASQTITLTDILTTDQAPLITVLWLDSNGVTLYTASSLNLFDQYNKSFFYSLTQNQNSLANIVSDSAYYENKAKLWAELVGAYNAVAYGGDIYSAQQCLDRASNFRTNQNLYF